MEVPDMEDPAPMPDATMLDPMEDLFGDAVVALPPPAVPGGLVLGVAESQICACCTKLAWSKTGSIACISPDGSKLTFRDMVRSRKDGAWKLSAEGRHPIVAPEGRKFVHLRFNGTGCDLAIADHLGTVYPYNLSGALGRMHLGSGDIVGDGSPRTELDVVVGLHWLPAWKVEFKGPHLDLAAKNGDKWEASMKFRQNTDAKAHHPIDSHVALLHVNRVGKLTLLYQGEYRRWMSTSIVLDSTSSSPQLLLHADIEEDGSDLLVATHDVSSQLRLYRVSINWNTSQHARANGIVTTVAPILGLSARLTAVHGVHAQHAESARISHLRIIPSIPDFMQAAPTSPIVLAIFTHASLGLNGNLQAPFSVIARWQVETATPVIHESFGKLKSGGNTKPVTSIVTALRRLPDVTTNKVILTVDSQYFDTLLAFGASDGSLDLRNRISMEPCLPTYTETTIVENLLQSGFEHVGGDHNIQVAFSPGGSALAAVRADDTLEMRTMSFRYGWEHMNDEISDDKAFIEAGAVCVAREFVLMVCNNSSNDEALALLPLDLSPEMRSLVVRTILRMLRSTFDVAVMDLKQQNMYIFQDPNMARLFSAQLALGTNPISGERDFGAQFGFAVLNLRQAGSALIQSMNSRDPLTGTPSPETMLSLRGLVKWTIDLMIETVAVLYSTERADMPVKDYFESKVADGNPCLHLLVSSFSRALLKLATLFIGKYHHILVDVIKSSRSTEQRQQLTSILQMMANVPFSLNSFESTVLTELDQAIRGVYATCTPERRGEIEADILVDGTIPDEFTAALESLVKNTLPKFSSSVDHAKLYFWETDWLSLKSSIPPAGGTRYDVYRKVPLTKGMLLRRCRRCGAEMEDVAMEKTRELAQWQAQSLRLCICTNYWTMPPQRAVDTDTAPQVNGNGI